MSSQWDEYDRYTAEFAKERRASHAGGNTAQHFLKDPDVLETRGVRAEWAFARAFGLPYDYARATQQVSGDGGIDFTVYLIGHDLPLTIDIKASEHPGHLLVKDKDIVRSADILVLALDKYDNVTFLGWETRNIMALMPVRPIVKDGQLNFIRPREMLRPMDQLVNLLARRDPSRTK